MKGFGQVAAGARELTEVHRTANLPQAQRCRATDHTAASLKKSLAAEVDATSFTFESSEVASVWAPQQVATPFPSRNRVEF